MEPTDDSALLRQYAENNSDEAFAALVTRHINLVYSVALRQVGNAHAAEEITQAVFIILAKKAAQLRHDKALGSWLFQATRLTANNFIRSEARRHRREEEACMQSILNESETEVWPKIAPLLDDAVAGLREKDRRAIVLRFYEGRNLREVGMALGASESAAEKRVSRALEKLRRFFTKRGVSSTTAIIAGAISANSVQSAPVALAKSVTAVAIAKGAAASVSTFALVKGTLKIMIYAKLKLVAGIGAAVLLAGGIITVAVTNMTDEEDRYQIDGDLVYNTNFIRNFTLTVNGRNWAIHLTDPKEQTTGIKYQEVVLLNGSVYSYTCYGKQSPGGPVNSGSAVIEYGDFPIEDGTFANFVWVGLASASYFAGATNGDVGSLLSHPRDARTYKVAANWQLSDQPPHLPKSIDYYVKAGSGLLGHDGSIMHQFDNGWKSGEVRVLSETNINNKTFPMAYTYEQFRPKLDGVILTNDVEHQFFVMVNVHSVRLDSVPDVLPLKTVGTTAIGETRFPNNAENKQTLYFSKLDHLPEKTEAEAVKEYNLEHGQSSNSSATRHLKLEQHSSHKWIWISIALLVSAIAAITFLIKRKR
jgi:RNA polymerase sigma factor (sigma-70 family)